MERDVEKAWARIRTIGPDDEAAKTLVALGIAALDRGEIRAAKRVGDEWVANEWVKKLILLSFRVVPGRTMPTGHRDPLSTEMNAYDKFALKTVGWGDDEFERAGFRMVPGAMVRSGAYVGPSAVLMPSFVNIGAHVGQGTMVDTWATIGSCAQIGARCHISGGAGIGGVLEPLNARPVVLEDDVFVGARSEVVEGVVVRERAVLSMGVFLGASTPIVDRQTGKVMFGEVPAGAVVLPGSRPTELPDGSTVNMPCALIVKTADSGTRSKVDLNELVRH